MTVEIYLKNYACVESIQETNTAKERGRYLSIVKKSNAAAASRCVHYLFNDVFPAVGIRMIVAAFTDPSRRYPMDRLTEVLER